VVRTGSALDVAQIPLTGSAAAIRYRGQRASGAGGRILDAAGATAPAAPAAAAVQADTGTDVGRAQPRGSQAGAGAPAVGVAFGSNAPASGGPLNEPSQIVYSATDTAVQPAVLSKPQLLPPPYSDRQGKPVRLELIISPAGTVERARFLEAPQRMADMMILSSAKTWQFTPALKDGQPVRYRTVLSWLAAP
jgi:TonB family protein